MAIPSSSAPSSSPCRMPPAFADLATAWAFLEDGLDEIMANGPIKYTTYFVLYTVAYNYCTSSRMRGAPICGADTSEVPCSALYDRLVGYFAHHVKGVKEQSDRLRGEALLRYYAGEWDRYTTRATYIHRVFTYLNRHWVKPAQEGRADVYPVYTLALVQWKSFFFDDGQNGLAGIVRRLIEGEWNGQPINHDYIKKVIDSFISLGLDENVNTASL